MSLIRVSSGKFKGQKISVPKGLTTRPTASKVREAVINILSADWHNSNFIDFFSGSGIMGIEALSQGCSDATFIEKDRSAAATIRKNLTKLGCGHHTLWCQDVKRAAKNLKQNYYHIGWADPPYDQVIQWLPWFEQLIPKIMIESGVFVLESRRDAVDAITTMANQSQYLELDKTKVYGQSLVCFFRRF